MDKDLEMSGFARFIAHEGAQNADIVVLAVTPVQEEGDEKKQTGRNGQGNQPGQPAIANAHLTIPPDSSAGEDKAEKRNQSRFLRMRTPQ